MKTLFVAFKGINNSSRLVLSKLNVENKLYLENNRIVLCKQISNILVKNTYDRIIILGQRPLLKNKVSLELKAYKEKQEIETNYDLTNIYDTLKCHDIIFKISTNPGTSFCNCAYFHTLSLIKNFNLHTKIIFIHIPYIKNFENIDKFITCLENL